MVRVAPDHDQIRKLSRLSGTFERFHLVNLHISSKVLVAWIAGASRSCNVTETVLNGKAC
jgi:hypothetical protein